MQPAHDLRVLGLEVRSAPSPTHGASFQGPWRMAKPGPMSLLADHPDVQFNYFRGGLGRCVVEMR